MQELKSLCFVGAKIGIIRHQIPMISGMMNVLSGEIFFCKITHASNIFMIHMHRDSLGRFVLIVEASFMMMNQAILIMPKA